MLFALILIASILSALIFDLLSIIKSVNTVIGISKDSLQVMKSTDLDDERKQQLLLSNSGKMLLSSLKLSGLLIVIISPFFIIGAIEVLTRGTDSFLKSLGTLTGIGLSVLGFFFYFGGKKVYARL